MKNHLTSFVALTTIIMFIFALVPLRTVFATGVVGTATPATCTEAAFDTALKNGGQITFTCGVKPVVITLTPGRAIPTPCPPGYQGDPAHGIPCIPIPR